MVSEKQSQEIKNMQRRLFGERFVGATLSAFTQVNSEDIERIQSWYKNPKNFLVLCGPPGTGKTYFCAAILENIPKRIEFTRAYSEKKLLQMIRNSFSEKSKGDYSLYLENLIDDDLIIIDDIGATGYSEWREEILFDAVDYRYSMCKPTILTTNLSKNDVDNIYSKRLSSRIFARENTIIDMFNYSDLREEGY